MHLLCSHSNLLFTMYYASDPLTQRFPWGNSYRLMLAVQPVQEMLSALSLGSSEALGKGLTPFLLSLTENKTNI